MTEDQREGLHQCVGITPAAQAAHESVAVVVGRRTRAPGWAPGWRRLTPSGSHQVTGWVVYVPPRIDGSSAPNGPHRLALAARPHGWFCAERLRPRFALAMP
ncbi:hypothetical protein AQI88_16510 [Streptomyces cellostaticus]|uniref:Uncharacterized protein n=1 Tax=Streptomyces cellostaticus TaxID=67285 RepID=A0A101NLU5_9ACTN|nr:hypothetical protein AQI88_16510 [Streptomyces cellostaticus]GHI09738.1 hypothetical protein Scel_80590 [Streptomyces cellostaticus]